MNTKYEASHCATSPILMLLNPHLAQIISLNPSLKQPQSMLFSEYMKEKKSLTPTQTTLSIMVLHLSTFTFPDSRREDKRL
jgi:hypothetical protein